MQGYNKEETKNNIDAKRWLHTDDAGYIDDDGYRYPGNWVPIFTRLPIYRRLSRSPN
jgi:acyl-CoA synthetase (AMP-forming)/AMP-acid ligase II